MIAQVIPNKRFLKGFDRRDRVVTAKKREAFRLEDLVRPMYAYKP